MRVWGNPEWCLVEPWRSMRESRLTAELWAEVDRVTSIYINRPENQKIIWDRVFGPEERVTW